MIRYFFRRLSYGLLVLLGVVFAVFFLFQGFGDPSRLVIGQRADAATQDNIRKELYLDQPRWKQFIFYLDDISPIGIHSREEIARKGLKGIFIGGHGEQSTVLAIKWPYLRRSYQSKRDVWDILMQALPRTIVLAFAAMLLATIGGISLGVLAAIRKGTWMDTTAIFVSVIGISAPSFFMGIVIAYLFGFVFSNITGLHMTGTLYRYRPLHRPPSRAAQPHPPGAHPGHPADGDHRPAHPRRPPRRARPGLYPDRLCERTAASGRHLETWRCATPSTR